MDKQELYRLTSGWLNNTLTDEEIVVLNNWYNQYGDNIEAFVDDDSEESLRVRMLGALMKNAAPAQVRIIRGWIKYAAAVILFIIAGAVYMKYSFTAEKPVIANNQSADILPGTNKATLIIDGGKEIALDTVNTDQLSHVLKIKNIQLSDKRLQYGGAEGNTTSETTYHTLKTPAGGQYQLSLPDGSAAWLNASSSIRFPVPFKPDERSVEVSGEVYFEIAKDSRRPFKVVERNETIEVLGTSFNINAYADEPYSVTTLINGSVRVNDNLLQPGEAYKNGETVRANVQQAIAWKNGIFNFDKLSFSEAMRQIARWYDVEIVYANGIPDKHFIGKMGRDLKLSQILKGLKTLGVEGKVEGRKLIILNK